MDSLPGFGEPVNKDNTKNEAKLVKKSSKKSGGFQSMGLSFNVLKGITRRGYKVPTPIQRKVTIKHFTLCTCFLFNYIFFRPYL